MSEFVSYRSLWRAVIRQAFQDLLQETRVQEYQEAYNFLTSTSGAWYASRVRACENAELCPRAVREHAIKILNDPEAYRRSGKITRRRRSK